MGFEDRGLDKIKSENDVDLENKDIIIVSDVHLGYRDKLKNGNMNSNKDAFKGFLKEIKLGQNPKFKCDFFIIAGDFLDIWRRDLAGVVMENRDVLELLDELQKGGIEIKFIVGNHDYWLRRINKQNFGYNFTFLENLLLKYQNKNYFFFHGDRLEYWKFLKNNIEAIYDGLCLTDDNAGTKLENAWQLYLSLKGSLLERIIGVLFGHKRSLFNQFFIDDKRELKTAEDRFTRVPSIDDLDDLNPVEKEAILLTREENLNQLVFGHTHRPFHFKDSIENFHVLNTGSWVKNGDTANTYVQVKAGNPNLYRYVRGQGEIINLFIDDSKKLLP
ncbi:MAG: UDP-2,3-diacylglucosamine diphosphatase [Candidatus Hodarchaeota archaeon]